MPSIKRHKLDHSVYYSLNSHSARMTERSDCAVIAATALSEKPYAEVHAMFASLGRKSQTGTNWGVMAKAFTLLGLKLIHVEREHFLGRYPKAHRCLRNVTTHHPDRFKKVWADGNAYLFDTGRHVLAVKNGVNMDWTRGTATRVKRIYRVEPII